ncbi:MAG: sulfatase-like hydrolase/transferase [Deltaproteobacteria bacterium]|jgi:arylsulfatase|nr:sulfatase-like hydrolase/transferase [Deltaproteobacteria bacterium]
MSQSDKSKDNSAKGLSRRDFLQTAGIATLAIGSGAMSMTPETAQAKQPSPGKTKPGGPIKPKRYNVLFILTDQERYLPELSGKGHWPGRDRLTKMGTTFENHQVCSMVCTPSRSVIFTGQHIQHTKMFDNTNFPWVDDMSFDIPTIGHMMRDAGYYSTYQGKWHLNERIHEHFPEGKPFQMVGHDIMEKYGFSDFTGIGDVVGDPLFGYYTDQFVTATSQAWLRRKGKSLNDEGQPWFMTLSLVNPHDVMFYDTDKLGQEVQGDPKPMFPITRDPDDKIYKKKWDVPLSPSRKEPWDKPGRPAAHYDYQKSMAMLTGKIPNQDERWRRLQDYYFNCISDNDRSVGTILTELENLGMLENTIVMLTADHGELCGAHGMSGKGATAYREQNNVPFIVYHPDMPGGKKCKAVTAHNDLVPTILAMTGADKKQKKKVADRLHGHDVSPLLENPQKASFDAIRDGALYCYSMWAFMDGDWLQKVGKAAASGKEMTVDTMPRPDTKKRSNIRTVYDGRYKYSRYFNSQEHNRPTTFEQIFEVNDVELFDLKNDPNEMNNLALDKKKRDVLLAMNDKLNRLIDSEVGKDDGSHLPDIAGVNWAFERFDP